MRQLAGIACWALLSVLHAVPVGGTASAPAEPWRVLFIGNSYTYVNNLPSVLEDLTVANGESRTVKTTMIAVGGATLEAHWKKGDARTALQNSRWDFVVLQEQSVLPTTDPERMYYYGRLFNALIAQSGAKTILFVTWARAGRPEMQPALDRAYTTLARETGAQMAPIGPAWQRALRANARLALYQGDGSHPTEIGTYLGACVLYSVIYGRPPRQRPDHLGGLAPADAALAQEVAWEAVQARDSDQQVAPSTAR